MLGGEFSIAPQVCAAFAQLAGLLIVRLDIPSAPSGWPFFSVVFIALLRAMLSICFQRKTSNANLIAWEGLLACTSCLNGAQWSIWVVRMLETPNEDTALIALATVCIFTTARRSRTHAYPAALVLEIFAPFALFASGFFLGNHYTCSAFSVCYFAFQCYLIPSAARSASQRVRAKLNKERLIAALTSVNVELRDTATIDALTRLPNRRAFDDHYRRAFREAARKESWISMLYIELDQYDALVDQVGQKNADDIVAAFAKTIVSCPRRPLEMTGSLGPGCFGIVLPDSGASAAQTVAERTRKAVKELTSTLGDGISASLTISVGFAAMQPKRGQPADELFELARAGHANLGQVVAPAANLHY